VLYTAALKHVDASRAAIVATVEPVSAAAFALVILGETLSPIQLLGGVLVLAGAMLAQHGGVGQGYEPQPAPVTGESRHSRSPVGVAPDAGRGGSAAFPGSQCRS